MSFPPDRRLCAPVLALVLTAACLTAACTTAPVAPIPLPLPETLAWARGAAGGPGGPGDDGAFLGLKTRENLTGTFDDLDFQPGLRVTRVVENSPAAHAGLLVGDVVLAFGEKRTDEPSALAALVDGAPAGQRVELEVRRGDSIFRVPVTLGAPVWSAGSAGSDGADGARRDAAERVQRLDPSRSRAGWLTGRGGVVLVASDPRAPFPRAGVPVGSVVRSIDGEPVVADAELVRRLQALAPGARVEVEFTTPDGEDERARVTLQDEDRRVTAFSIPIVFSYYAEADGSSSSFALLDLWLISLVRYAREGEETRWTFLRFFEFASGVGEMAE